MPTSYPLAKALTLRVSDLAPRANRDLHVNFNSIHLIRVEYLIMKLGHSALSDSFARLYTAFFTYIYRPNA